MSFVILAIIVLVLCFGIVLFFGPPFVPTLHPQIIAAFELLDLQPGQTILELGSGDGRVLVEAAKRGLRAVGYELNPLLVLISFIKTWRYRKQVCVVWGSFWQDWPPAEGIFTFMLPRYMQRLDHKIKQWHTKPVKLASFAFAIPQKTPTNKKSGVWLYEYQ